jgi:hypothetical protein
MGRVAGVGAFDLSGYTGGESDGAQTLVTVNLLM